MYQVVKRDGQIAEFDIHKIGAAIQKAFEAAEKKYHPSIIDMLALKVTANFEPKIKNEKIKVEEIQDLRVLLEAVGAQGTPAVLLANYTALYELRRRL